MLRHLVDHFLDVYRAEHKALGGRHPIHERGGYACGFPGCWKRVCEDEHMEPKSLGGSDDPQNRHLLCAGRHRIAKHLGLAKVWGRVPAAEGSGWPHEIYFRISHRIWKDNRLVQVLDDG